MARFEPFRPTAFLQNVEFCRIVWPGPDKAQMQPVFSRTRGPWGRGFPSTGGTGNAFSALELLAVVAILALLAALLLPALAKAREQGRSSVCRSNMRQIGLAMTLYADENSDYLPWPGDTDRNWQPDWVFGGQADTFADNSAMWMRAGFGFHAESGSIFSY